MAAAAAAAGSWARPHRRVILASGSPRRKELLAQLGVAFDVIVQSIDDEAAYFTRSASVIEGLEALARAKAAGVAAAHPDAAVLGSDTIIVHGGRVLGKPRDAAHAHAMLSEFSGETHKVITCVSLECVALGFHRSVVVETDVTFRTLEDWEIRQYLSTAKYDDKAGAYGIQAEGAVFVERVAGCYTNVVGFPLSGVVGLMKALAAAEEAA